MKTLTTEQMGDTIRTLGSALWLLAVVQQVEPCLHIIRDICVLSSGCAKQFQRPPFFAEWPIVSLTVTCCTSTGPVTGDVIYSVVIQCALFAGIATLQIFGHFEHLDIVL